LVITEKPSAAKKIAEALDDNHSPQEVTKGKSSHFLCSLGTDDLTVVNALGHLYELKQTEKGWTYPRLETEWVPKYEVDKKATGIKPLIALIGRLAKKADGFVVATDFDIEGSLIGYLTLKYACQGDAAAAKRMRFSSLTIAELKQAYQNRGELDFPMIDAGLVRHEVDWLYGINLTRALTLSIKNTEGWFKIVSTGRVQGPALSFVIGRERDINVFVPVPYWAINAKGVHKGELYELEYQRKRIDTEAEALAIEGELKNQPATVSAVSVRTSTQPPHPPFSLSALQSEAYRHFGFKPSRTLAIAQKLYLDALISYPRTSSEQLPNSLDLKSILSHLAENRSYKSMAESILKKGILEPVQGKKTDPAHPAIHPTGEKPGRLAPSDKKIYDLIVRRFLALFEPPAVKEHLRVDLRCGNHLFFLRGLQITELGWMETYNPYVRTEEKILPKLVEGDILELHNVQPERKYTQPPTRYNPSSLLKLLEKEGLGTKATRSSIVDSLKSRGYCLNDRFEVSTLGFAVYEALEEYVPDVLSTEFTRIVEDKMEAIQEGATERAAVVDDAKDSLLSILKEFQKKEKEIGLSLVEGLKRYWKEKEELGPCPKCGSGTLLIIRSTKTGKRFVGCSNYREQKCDLTFPLPQKGTITPLDEFCEYCGHKLIRVASGRRPWITCINWAKCPGRQNEIKKQTEKQEGQQ
jgi:DNA topoisomerase-1